MKIENTIKKIVGMFESGELSLEQKNHSWNDYDIQVDEQTYNQHGLDGYLFQISKDKNMIVKIFYDSWSRFFYQDIINPNVI